MSLKIGICDDDIKQCELVQEIVSQWATINSCNVEVEVFNSGENFIFNHPINDFDILLLDIEMGDLNGVELAKEIRTNDDNVQIIFITGYMEYIADGYEVSALHYLMKPLNGDKLLETLDRAVTKLKKNEQHIIIKSNEEVYKILLSDIKYIEVNGNYTTIFGKNIYKCKRTLSDILKELDDNFFKISRSYVLNLTYISRVSKTQVFLTNGDIIPLPRGRYEALNNQIITKI